MISKDGHAWIYCKNTHKQTASFFAYFFPNEGQLTAIGGAKKEGDWACIHVSIILIPPPPPVPPVAPRRQRLWFLANPRGEEMSVHVKDKFTKSERSLDSTAVAKRWNTRKFSSTRFYKQDVARSTEERSKSGEPPLTPASAHSVWTQQDILQALWRTLNSEYCSSESVLKQRRPGQLDKLRLSPTIKTD